MLHEGLDFRPVQAAHTGGEAGEGHAQDAFLGNQMAEFTECMINICDGGPSEMSAIGGDAVLGEEVGDAETWAGPEPELAGVRMLLIAEMAKNP